MEELNSFTPPGIELRPYTPDVLLQGDETLELAGISFQTLRVPGHSPAHLAYYADGALFSGDLVFAGSVGRTDLPGADWDVLVESIRMLADRFPPETVVYSGHGPEDDARHGARTESVSRGAARVTRFEAPRGTHDILPSEQPLWQWVTGEMQDVCALYGYGVSTPPPSRTPS